MPTITESTTITARLVAMRSSTRFMGFVLLCPRSTGGGLYGFQDGARAFLGDDVGRRIGVSRGDARKHRCVDNAQPADAVHPELVVHDRQRVAAHFAGTHRM